MEKQFTINEQLAACLKHCKRNEYEIMHIQIDGDTVFYFINNHWVTEAENLKNPHYITIFSLIDNSKNR